MTLKRLCALTAVAVFAGTGLAIVPPLTPTADAIQATKAETITLKVAGMTCGGCAVSVKRAGATVDGVSRVTVSHEKGEAEVTYDPAKTTPETIAHAITKHSGFTASRGENASRTLAVEGLPRRGQH